MSGIFNLPGVMITASHNPKEWNGFKFCKAGSKPVGIETGLNEIKGLINPSNSYEEISPVNQEDIFDEYVNHISSIIDLSRINKEINIGIDAGNGVAGAFIPKLLERYGVSFSGIFLEPDGNFPNHPADPSNQNNLNDLLELVLKNNLDFGVAFDGDADRAVFLDNKGNLISGSMMTAVISEWLFLKNKELKVVHNVNVSPSIVDHLTSKGVTMIRSKVGHSYIKEVMRIERADFGGEHSAHFYYKDNYYADSGMITLLMFIQILSEKKVKASELITGYNFRPSSGEINFEVADTKESLNKIEEFFEGSFDKLDGLTYLSDDYWFNVRGSNTEPKLRLNAEAVNQETLDDIITQIKNIIGE
jgi:phosphomannomutase